MISYLKGELSESRPGSIIVDVNGVGYLVNVAESTREAMPSIGNQVKVFTYMAVREDAIALYGFVTREHLDMFLSLIGVSGVGPKGAMLILDTFSVMELRRIIVTEDSTKLSKAPTIGKKTAERIIIDLKDKVKNEDLIEDFVSSESSKETVATGNVADAIDALVALGYDRRMCVSAVKEIEGADGMSVNDILKKALQYLY